MRRIREFLLVLFCSVISATSHASHLCCPYDRVQTSYVTVEPKRRKPAPSTAQSPLATSASPGIPPTYVSSTSHPSQAHSTQPRRGSSGRELRRARIVITVRRTESYKRWLEENPLQAIIAGDADDELAENTATERQTK